MRTMNKRTNKVYKQCDIPQLTLFGVWRAKILLLSMKVRFFPLPYWST